MATDDFLYVDIVGDRNLTRNLDQMPDIVRAILLEKVKSWTNETANLVRQNIETRLNKTGKSKEYSGSPIHMKDAVQVEVISDGIKVDGRVYIEGIPYAKAQEGGAVIPPHMIYPKKGKILAFMAATGDKVFATRVFHPGSTIPASHFMKDVYREMGPQISRGIKTAVVQGIRAHMRSGR